MLFASFCFCPEISGGELYDRIQQKQYYPEVEAPLHPLCTSTLDDMEFHGPQAKAAVRCLLEAVAYIHGHGIMHRPTVYCIRELLVVRRMCISQSLQALEEIYVQKILNCL